MSPWPCHHRLTGVSALVWGEHSRSTPAAFMARAAAGVGGHVAHASVAESLAPR